MKGGGDMKDYTARVTRDGRWWMVSVDGLDGRTQARRLSEAEQMAREFVAVSLDVPVADVRVHLRVETVAGVDVRAAVDSINSKREEARRLEREASAAAIAIAQELAKQDVPVRDIGTALGVSYQRASQLVNA